MNIHEFGNANKKHIILIHPAIVKWDYFEKVIPLLEKDYHVIVPALPGYDFENESDFTGVEHIAKCLNCRLLKRGITEVYAVYGCSMGGSVALMFTLQNKIKVKHCIMDGGITPYTYPWIITRFIAIKDFFTMMLGRAGGVKLLQKMFSSDNYSLDSLKYIADVLHHCSPKTIWRTFESANNYKLPQPLPKINTEINYWYSENEEKVRRKDIAFIKNKFPQTKFKAFSDIGHAGLVLFKPEEFVKIINEMEN